MAFLPKPDACKGCPAHKAGRSFVRPQGPPTAELALIGQGPGEQEAYAGMPFIGPTGQRLNRWLRSAGLERYELFITNVVWCWLPRNRAPTTAEVAYCRTAHWGPALAGLPNLKVLVPVGIPAASAILGEPCGESIAGSVRSITMESLQ